MPLDPADPTPEPMTIPASEVAEVFPFLSPGKENFDASYANCPTLGDAIFTPDDPSQPDSSPGTIIVQVTAPTGATFDDFGYVILAEIDGEFKAYEPGKINIPGGPKYITAKLPKKPPKLRVTILTRKSVNIAP
jgi:hypothetical protein